MVRNFNNNRPLYLNFSNILLSKYLIHRKFKMSAIFILKKEPPKNPQIFHVLRGRYFVMGGPIDMNVDVF